MTMGVTMPPPLNRMIPWSVTMVLMIPWLSIVPRVSRGELGTIVTIVTLRHNASELLDDWW